MRIVAAFLLLINRIGPALIRKISNVQLLPDRDIIAALAQARYPSVYIHFLWGEPLFMLLQFACRDPILGSARFRADEVPYNLIHRISESDRSTCLKSPDGALVFAQSEGLNGWLWIAGELEDAPKRQLVRELIDALRNAEIPGVTGKPATAELFATAYAAINGLKYERFMTMESYVCAGRRQPPDVGGRLLQAGKEHAELVARYLAGFYEDALGATVEPSGKLKEAESIIAAGGLYLWVDGSEPVSMANIAHRSPRHARINAVYTPPACRKRGYATALVAGLCRLLQPERLLPMLYTDAKNPDSNKVYRSIGFEPAGMVADCRFGR